MTYRDFAMELLGPVGDVTIKAMFGGYGIFEDVDMFVLISRDDRIYFKVDDTNRADFEAAGSEQFKPMPYYEVPEEVLADEESFVEWAGRSIAIAHSAASGKKRSGRRKQRA